MPRQQDKINVLDLFCGCGGLSLGFEQAGYNIVMGIDVWPDALRSYGFNHKDSKTMEADLSELAPEMVDKAINYAKIIQKIKQQMCNLYA